MGYYLDFDAKCKKYLEVTVRCSQCDTIYYKSKRSRHVRSPKHIHAVKNLRERCDELIGEYRKLKLILNTPR